MDGGRAMSCTTGPWPMPLRPASNTGTVMGTTGRYEFYVVEPEAPKLFITSPDPGFLPWTGGIEPVHITGRTRRHDHRPLYDPRQGGGHGAGHGDARRERRLYHHLRCPRLLDSFPMLS